MSFKGIMSGIGSAASSAASSVSNAARNAGLSFTAGYIRPNSTFVPTLSGLNKFAFQAGRAVGLSVQFVRSAGAYIARGTAQAWSRFTSAMRTAGARIKVLASKVARGIKTTTFRIIRGIQSGISKARSRYVQYRGKKAYARAAARTTRTAKRVNARLDRQARRQAWRDKSPMQKMRTMAGKVDDLYFRAAQKLVGDRTMYNELHPLPDNATKRQRYKQEAAYSRAVTRVATGLEAATATLAVGGITGAVHIAQNMPQGGEDD